jgi:hypothetical protein
LTLGDTGVSPESIDVPMPTLTLSRALLVMRGVSPANLQRPTLTPQVIHALKPLLKTRGFDVTQPILVQELGDFQGFRLTQ